MIDRLPLLHTEIRTGATGVAVGLLNQVISATPMQGAKPDQNGDQEQNDEADVDADQEQMVG